MRKYNDLSTQNLWFLQTNLSQKLRQKVSYLVEDGYTFEHIFSILRTYSTKFHDIQNSYDQFIKKQSKTLINTITKCDIEYLRGSSLSLEAPLALEYRGSPTLFSKKIIGLVGSRHPTYYGRIQAQRFARELSALGFVIVSGGAIGVDTIANLYGLSNDHGGSIAVIGSGLNSLYPASNNMLFERIATSKNGLLLSEFESNLSAKQWHFPMRNRTIAELCDFLLVIEASKTSGSLMTAQFAKERGKEVGALPGNIDNPNTAGSHFLIQEGAHCIHTPSDVAKFFL